MSKVTDLTNEQLDYWVAKAQGWHMSLDNMQWLFGKPWTIFKYTTLEYSPTHDKAQAFELIEKFKIDVATNEIHEGNDEWKLVNWMACSGEIEWLHNEDLATAICQAVIISKFGEEVDDE